MGMPIPFVGESYTLESLDISAQRCLNWFPEVLKSGKNNIVLRNTPGLRLFVTLPGGGDVRGLYVTSTGVLYGVCGDTVSYITTGGTAQEVGTINTFDGIVRMTDNGTDLIIVDRSSGWLVKLTTNVLSIISSAGYPDGNFVSFIDGYFLSEDPGTGKFFWSNLYDGETWDALDFTTAEGSPDQISALMAIGKDLWVFGSRSLEVYYNSGDADTPFQRIEGSFNDIGCIAPDSLARMGKNLFWVGSSEIGSGSIYMSQGYEPVAISTVAIEDALGGYSTLTDAVGFCYSQNGHSFYQVSFPYGNTTWVYDLTTNMWHERNYTDSDNTAYHHLAQVQIFFNGKNYVGDRTNGNVYEYATDAYTDNGDEIHRVRSSPHIWSNLERVFYASFQLDMEVGVGLANGQGSDPQVMLDWSNDGGHTWSNEQWKSIGKMGEYKTRVKWNRLGSARDRVFRVKITDPVKCNLIGAIIT